MRYRVYLLSELSISMVHILCGCADLASTGEEVRVEHHHEALPIAPNSHESRGQKTQTQNPPPTTPASTKPSPSTSSKDPEQVRMRNELTNYMGSLAGELAKVLNNIPSEAQSIRPWWLNNVKKEELDRKHIASLRHNANVLETESRNPDFPKTKSQWAAYIKAISAKKYDTLYFDVIAPWNPGALGDFTDKEHSYESIVRKIRENADRLESILLFAEKIGKMELRDLKLELEKMEKRHSRAEKLEKKIKEITTALDQGTIYTWQFSELIKPVGD